MKHQGMFFIIYRIVRIMMFFYNCYLFDKTTNTTYELDTETFDVTIANIPRPVDKIKFKDDLKGGPDFT